MDNVWAHPGQITHHLGQFADDEFAWISEMDTAPGRPCQKAARVKARAMLCRRSLIATAIGGGVPWLSGHMSFLAACRDRARPMFDSGRFAALCSELSYPETIGKTCLEALPAIETSKEVLTRVILGDMQAAGRDCSSASALAHAIRERSRDDFRDGKIVNVDGWVLSLTETRVYALAALLPQPHEAIE